ncbi:hypothetical protein BTW08_05105 [Salinicola sp. MH3R3-1]|uniref:DUF6356 family protein n=1 Tax=Salinicola sp. MH3R3-1 TaxID=1928762 RepID=UPI00094F31DF|nr:DUF6356 family protein [Salinicola sp. MH3R3-1]OLO08702.1 hypothetical protein BTW08_05105 [Salinicola sp. MH3R3-1]
MSLRLTRLFTDHPASVEESYFEHLRFAGAFAGQLLLAGLAASIHAVLPFLFESTASRIITQLHTRLQRRP